MKNNGLKNTSIDEYLNDYKAFIKQLDPYQQRKECISGYNRIERMSYWTSVSDDLTVKVGDICYFEFGQAFLNEAGYQHFGLVVSIYNFKLWVIPMTSNHVMVSQSMNVLNEGKSHLFCIGKVQGLNKPSVLFMNDAKFLNGSRVISINGHIPPNSKMFKEIISKLYEYIFIKGMMTDE